MTVPAAWRAIAVVLLAATAVRCTVDVSNYCADNSVTVNGYYCATCLQVVYCVGEVTTLIETCHNEVCGGNQTYSTCVPIQAAKRCQCDSYNQCDSYSPTKVFLCPGDGTYDVVECEGEDTCSSGKCGSVVPGIKSCLDAPQPITPQWYFTALDCSKGFYCREDGSQLSVQCLPKYYYVDEEGVCQESPPLPCSTSCLGPCPDYSDCTRYFYCDATSGPLDVTQCPEGQFFDQNAEPVPRCQADKDKCDPLTFCDFDAVLAPVTTPGTTTTITTTPRTTTTIPVTTTPVTATATPCSAGVEGSFPSGPCSSDYWTCRDVGNGNFESVPMECPDELVFNTDPADPNCRYPKDVDSCN